MIARAIEFIGRDGFPVERIMRAIFESLAPDRPLPTISTTPVRHRSNWGIDQAYYTSDGDGILISNQCRGAVAGEDMEIDYNLTIGLDIELSATVVTYGQDTIIFHVSATAELVDAATNALLKHARANGLKRVSG